MWKEICFWVHIIRYQFKILLKSIKANLLSIFMLTVYGIFIILIITGLIYNKMRNNVFGPD